MCLFFVFCDTYLLNFFNVDLFSEIADQIVGEILKLIVPVSLLRFQTVELHRLVSSLIDNLSKNYPIETLNGLSKTISKLFRNYKQSS